MLEQRYLLLDTTNLMIQRDLVFIKGLNLYFSQKKIIYSHINN
jgi:hypothetical protein